MSATCTVRRSSAARAEMLWRPGAIGFLSTNSLRSGETFYVDNEVIIAISGPSKSIVGPTWKYLRYLMVELLLLVDFEREPRSDISQVELSLAGAALPRAACLGSSSSPYCTCARIEQRSTTSARQAASPSRAAKKRLGKYAGQDQDHIDASSR